MDPQDDPEARIRELESSLKDGTAPSELTQSSSEMGSASEGYGSGAAYPPSPPGPPTSYVSSAPRGQPGSYGPPASFGQPPPYGAPPGCGPPFASLPVASSGRVGRSGLVIGVMTLVTVGIIAGSVIWASNLFSEVTSFVHPSPDRTTVAGGGGPFGTGSGSQVPTALVPTVEPTAPGPSPGGTYSVSGVGENKSFACNDGVISISGVSNTVAISGHCASVTVSGLKNDVTVDEADTISASGFTNRVTYRTGSPDIQKSGDDNTVEQG